MGLRIPPDQLLNARGVDQTRLASSLAQSRTVGPLDLPSGRRNASQGIPGALATPPQKPPVPQTRPKPINWAVRAATLDATILPPGTEIVRFKVHQRAKPWSVPQIGKRRVKKNPALIDWQAAVAVAAKLAMEGRQPYQGHFKIMIKFAFIPRGVEPDWTNVTKSTEDALQGIVVGNDRKAVRAYAEKWESDENYAIVRVVASDRLIERGGKPVRS